MILVSGDKAQFYNEVTATGAQLDGLLQLAQGMCESEYGAGRPLEITTFTDIVEYFPMGQVAYAKRSPVISVSEVSIRGKSNNFGGTTSEWQLQDPSTYTVDNTINQINVGYTNNWALYGNSGRGDRMEAKIVYSSGFDFTITSNQEINSIKAICGRIVSYMNQVVAIGKANITDVDGFQSFVSGDNFLGLFLNPLQKYRAKP